MDRYFYSVELDRDGNKVVHLSGNVYLNDGDDTETNHRIAEWTFLYIPIDELKELIKNDRFYEYANERVDYLDDVSEVEALKVCDQYFDGNPGTYLHVQEVNEDTPCGDYYF